jgi:hypothetical protein
MKSRELITTIALLAVLASSNAEAQQHGGEPPRIIVTPLKHSAQVAAEWTEPEARKSYQWLQRRHPTVLGSREASFFYHELNGRGFYRVEIDGFEARELAEAFCTSLRTLGGQCEPRVR